MNATFRSNWANPVYFPEERYGVGLVIIEAASLCARRCSASTAFRAADLAVSPSSRDATDAYTTSVTSLHEVFGFVVNVDVAVLGLLSHESTDFFPLPELEEGDPVVIALFRLRTGVNSPDFSITVFAWFPLEPLSLKVTPANFFLINGCILKYNMTYGT